MSRAFVSVFIIGSLAATAQTDPPNPAIAPFGIVHGASNGAGLTTELARGGIFLVRGAWLGSEDLVLGEPPFQPELAGSRLEIRSMESGIVYSAAMIHAWNFQLAGILPFETPAGPAQVTAVYEDRRGPPVEILVVDSLPGLFAVSQQGFGPGVIQNFVSPAEQPLNTLTNPALPGQYIILWGTGLGEVSASDDAYVMIGTMPFKPQYAGPAPGLPGVDQFNVVLPDSEELPRGCYVPVSVSAGGRSSGRVSASIAESAGACDHPWQLPPETLEALDAGGRVKTLEVSVRDNDFLFPPDGPQPLPRRSLTAFANFELANASGVALRSPKSNSPFGGALAWCGSIPRGIIVGGIIGPGRPLPQPPPPPNPALVPADAGEALEFLGPDGRRFELRRASPRDGPGGPNLFDPYQFTQLGISDLLVPGSWLLQASGGADTEAFSAPVELPPLPAVAAPASIDFSRDITIEWASGTYEPDDSVRLLVGVYVPDESDPSRSIFQGASCSVPATEGSMTIRAAAFANVPASTDGMAVWQFSLRAPRDLVIPQLDHSELSFSISRVRMLPIE